jgi:hypothetical protein
MPALDAEGLLALEGVRTRSELALELMPIAKHNSSGPRTPHRTRRV